MSCKPRRILGLVLPAALLLLLAALCFLPRTASAEEDDHPTAEELEAQLSDRVDSVIDGLDLDLFEEFLASLEGSGGTSLKETLRQLTESGGGDISGKLAERAGDIFSEVLLGFLPGLVTVIAVCLLKGVLTGLTSGFERTGTANVVHIVCYSVIIAVLLAAATDVVVSVTSTVSALAAFSEAVFPVLLTLLSAVGGAGSAAVYQPFMGVLSGGIVALISGVVLPAFVAAMIFSAVGGISDNVRLNKLAKLMRSGSTWLIGIVFGLYATFLTVQGVTGGVIDKLGFSAAKFAVSSYVPVLGGYLSDGFDLLTASLVLVKNAVGVTGAAALVAVVLMPLVKVALFTLGLRLTAAVAEPVGDKKIGSAAGALADNMSLLVTALVGTAFMFFVLLLLIIGSCNPGV